MEQLYLVSVILYGAGNEIIYNLYFFFGATPHKRIVVLRLFIQRSETRRSGNLYLRRTGLRFANAHSSAVYIRNEKYRTSPSTICDV